MIKNQSVWMLTSCTKYQVFVSLCFMLKLNGITFINPTAVDDVDLSMYTAKAWLYI